jgi:hypothetical protein
MSISGGGPSLRCACPSPQLIGRESIHSGPGSRYVTESDSKGLSSHDPAGARPPGCRRGPMESHGRPNSAYRLVFDMNFDLKARVPGPAAEPFGPRRASEPALLIISTSIPIRDGVQLATSSEGYKSLCRAEPLRGRLSGWLARAVVEPRTSRHRDHPSHERRFVALEVNRKNDSPFKLYPSLSGPSLHWHPSQPESDPAGQLYVTAADSDAV